jgi:hypothetical protein
MKLKLFLILLLSLSVARGNMGSAGLLTMPFTDRDALIENKQRERFEG